MSRPEMMDPVTQPPMELGQQHEAVAQSNIYRIAWQRKSLLFLGLLVGLVIGALIYSQKDPVYQSTAQIAVLRKSQMMQPQDPRAIVFDDYLTYHASQLRNTTILNELIKDNKIKNLDTFANKTPVDMMGIIMGGLMVNRDNRDPNVRSPILQLTFKGPVANDCQAILEGIIRQYQDFLKRTYADQGSELLQGIKKYQEIISEDVKQLAKRHADFRDRSPPILSTKDGESPSVAKLKLLIGEKLRISKDILDIRSRKQVLEDGAKRGLGMSLYYLLPSSSLIRSGNEANSLPFINTNEQLMKLRLAEKSLSTKVGQNHPEYKDLQMQIDALQRYVNDQTKEMNSTGEGNKESLVGKESPLRTIMNSFELELQRLEFELKALDDEIGREREYAKEMGKVEMQDHDFEMQKKMQGELLTEISKKISTAKLVKDDEVFKAEMLQIPSPPQKVEPRFFVIMTLASVLGLLGGFGLAYLADMTDKSFRSPEEIRRRLNIPVVGHVPMLISEEEAAKLEGAINGPDPILVTYYRPKSRKAEVFRGIRTALYFNTRGEGHKVIQITSPNMGDGKTTLSSNLAVSIAQSGKQTILIDGDFRRPRLHKIFAVPSEKGFASVIMGQCDLRDAVQPSVVPGLTIMPCGPIPPNPAELLTSPRFKELLDELREQYDYVIIDTPPLLVVTDPCAVAPRVDGVLMTMRVIKNGRPIAERARDILLSLGAKPLGIVVNGVSMSGPTGYGYGSGYGYGYGYGQYDYAQAYQYKYDYSDRYYAGYGDEGYYQDREATEITPEMPHSNRLPMESPEAAKK